MKSMHYVTTGKLPSTEMFFFPLSCIDQYLFQPVGGDLTQAEYLQFRLCTQYQTEAFEEQTTV